MTDSAMKKYGSGSPAKRAREAARAGRRFKIQEMSDEARMTAWRKLSRQHKKAYDAAQKAKKKT